MTHDLALWQSLSEKERGRYAKQFFDSNLPPIESPLNLSFDFSSFAPLSNFSTLSLLQVKWYLFILKNLFEKNGVAWGVITEKSIAFMQKEPELEKLLYSYFMYSPIEFCSQEKPHLLENLFQNKPPIAKINEALQKALPEKLNALSPHAIRFLHNNLLNQNWQTKWIDLSRDGQQILNKQFARLKLKKLHN